jgi:hypothetical protein
MNLHETYLQDLALPSSASAVGATYEGVTPCALARYMGQARAPLPMWRHIGPVVPSLLA